MRNPPGGLLSIALVAGLSLSSDQAQASELTTLFASDNGGRDNGAVFFDITVKRPGGVRFTELDLNVSETTPGGVAVYVTFVGNSAFGNETFPGNWRLTSSGIGIGAGEDRRTHVDITDFTLSPGLYGWALVTSGGWDHNYTNGDGTNQRYSNQDLELVAGTAQNNPFSNDVPFSPRVWNGTIYYEKPPVPAPLPIFGAAAALGCSRRLRKRIARGQAAPKLGQRVRPAEMQVAPEDEQVPSERRRP